MRHLFHHHARHTVLAAIDPRVRLLAGMLLLALVVSSTGTTFPQIITAVCLPATMLCGMRMRTLLMRLLHPLFIAVVVLALKTFMGAGESQTLFTIGTFSLPFHANGFHEGMLIVSRIMGAVSVALFLGHVMTFTETMAALAWLRVPRGLVEVSLFAWRSLSMLYDIAGVVYNAQRNRLGYCSVRCGLRSFGSMAGMLIIRAFDSSDAMTTAMTQRGYDGTLPLLRDSRPSAIQFAGLFVFGLAAISVWTLQNWP